MSGNGDRDLNVTKQDLLDFKTWVERKFEDMTNQQPVTRSPQPTAEEGVSSATDFSFQLLEENPSSVGFDQDRTTVTRQEQSEKETINLLRNLQKVGSSHQQALLEIRDGQRKLESALQQEKGFMHEELKNAQEEIKKLKENVNYQTTHFENSFHELAKRLENKMQEVKSNVESQSADCAKVMSQMVKEITSKVDEERNKFLDVVHQRQLSPEENSSISDLRSMVAESQKDFLDQITKAVEYSVKGKIEGHFVWLDVQVRKSNDEMNAALQEQNIQITSAMNDLKNSMLTANQEVKDKVLHSETKLSQETEDDEKKIQETLQTMMAKLEEKLTDQHQRVEEQLQMLGSQTMKKNMEGITARLDDLSLSLTDQEAAYSQMSENCKTQILTLLDEKCQALEKDIKTVAQEAVKTVGESEKMTEVIKEIHGMKSQIMEDATSTTVQLEKQREEVQKSKQSIQENVKTQIIQCSTQITHKTQEIEEELKIYIAQQFERLEKVLATKLTNNEKNMKKEISGSTNTVTAQLQKNQEIVKEMRNEIKQQIHKSEKSLETKLTQNQESNKKEISGSTNNVIAQLQSNLVVVKEVKAHITQVFERTEKSIKEESEKVKTETLQQIKQSSHESTQTAKSDIETKLKSNTETVKDFMTDIKRELFKFTEKECSITRLKISNPTVKVRSSTFDLYVKNFENLVKTGKFVYSVPWYIDEFQPCVEGTVSFYTNGEMKVWLFHGRHYLEMGLQPRQVKLKVKVTITDRTGNLPDLLVGEVIMNANEESVKDNGNWGRHIGTLKCDDIITKKYNQCNYDDGAVLFRYHIEVV